MKYDVEIDGYTAEVKLDTGNKLDPEYIQDVVRMYAAFAAQHLSAPPELQDAMTRKVIAFSRKLAKDVETGKLGIDALVNSCAVSDN
jgi:hypothetical protein